MESRHESSAKTLKTLARPKRFELLTPKFVVWCSIQLSYGRAWAKALAATEQEAAMRAAT